jgi:hypothetical protein
MKHLINGVEYEVTIYDAMLEGSCFAVNEEQKNIMVKEIKTWDGYTLDVAELKNGKYRVELWKDDEEE